MLVPLYLSTQKYPNSNLDKKHPDQQNFSQKDANVHNIFTNIGFKDLLSYFAQ
jgi:hypothetical protein